MVALSDENNDNDNDEDDEDDDDDDDDNINSKDKKVNMYRRIKQNWQLFRLKWAYLYKSKLAVMSRCQKSWPHFDLSRWSKL